MLAVTTFIIKETHNKMVDSYIYKNQNSYIYINQSFIFGIVSQSKCTIIYHIFFIDETVTSLLNIASRFSTSQLNPVNVQFIPKLANDVGHIDRHKIPRL